MEAYTDAEIDAAVKFIFEKFDRDNNKLHQENSGVERNDSYSTQ